MNSDTLAHQLINDEKLMLLPYDDATGKPLKAGDTLKGNLTIGVGINLSSGISKEEAAWLLGNRMKGAIADLDNSLPWWKALSEARQQALANLCFNLGIKRLLGFVNTLAYLKQGDYKSAAHGIRDSLYAKQVGARALRIADLIEKG